MILSDEVLDKSGYLVVDEAEKELIEEYNKIILDTSGKPVDNENRVTKQELKDVVEFNNKVDSINLARREHRREARLAREAKKLDRKQKRNNRSKQKSGGKNHV